MSDNAKAAKITDATVDHADAMAALRVRSITELCGADHGGDADAIARWTANSTPAVMRDLIEGDETRVFVALEDGDVVGFAAMDAGAIRLMYVDPVHVGRGHGRALLAVVETVLQMFGVREVRLQSTRAGHGFYLAHGYEDEGETEEMLGLPAQPMVKRLDAPGSYTDPAPMA